MRILNLSFGAYKLYCGISVIDTSLHTLIRFQKGQIRNREYAEDNLIEFYRDLTLVSQKLSLSRYSALINKSAIIELLSSMCIFVSYTIHRFSEFKNYKRHNFRNCNYGSYVITHGENGNSESETLVILAAFAQNRSDRKSVV